MLPALAVTAGHSRWVETVLAVTSRKKLRRHGPLLPHPIVPEMLFSIPVNTAGLGTTGGFHGFSRTADPRSHPL